MRRYYSEFTVIHYDNVDGGYLITKIEPLDTKEVLPCVTMYLTEGSES